MYKDKNGKVFASLTEVKNKTGDIFSLADEYGEVTLTSYNKAKYKIVKIDIKEIVDLQESNEDSIFSRMKSSISSVIAPPAPKPQTEAKLGYENLIKELSNMKVWDRYSKEERTYSRVIERPLQ